MYPIHAAAGVAYGNGFTGNFHLHAPNGWLPAVKYLVDELGADVNARSAGGSRCSSSTLTPCARARAG